MVRQYIPRDKDGNVYKNNKFDDTIKLTDILNQNVVINGYKTVTTKFGEMLVIDTDKGLVTTYSGVILSQLEKEKEAGFPIEVKFKQKNNYYTLAAT